MVSINLMERDTRPFLNIYRPGAVALAGIMSGVSRNITSLTDTPPGGFFTHVPEGWTLVGEIAFNTQWTQGTNDAPWESGWSCNNFRNPPQVTRSSDATAPISPSFVGQFQFPNGMGDGSEPGKLYRSAGTGKSHYCGYSFKYSSNFVNHVVGTKQWYPKATNDYFVLWENNSNKMTVELQAGAGHGGTVRKHGNQAGDVTISLDTWYHFEILFIYPSSSIVSDGILRWWVDGVLAAEFTDISWDTSPDFDEWTVAPTWGGVVPTTVPHDMQWWVDHLKVYVP